jgi:D-3-phosphoglycerate dehydrogenase
MASGLGLNVVVFDVQQDPASMLKYVSMDEVLATSDILSLHCPAQADGRPLIDSAAIAGMKKGVFLINTARHSLLDVQPVLAALDSGQISGLATDVFEKEPPGEDALVDHARVIATPHIGGFTDESISRSVAVAVDNLLEVLATS